MPTPIGVGYAGSGGGGGGGTTPTLIAVAASPHAGWTQIPSPKAYRSGGKTFLGPWVNGSNAHVEVAEYVHATRTLSTPFALFSGGSIDNHRSGSIIVRERGAGAAADGRLVAAHSDHDGSILRVWISTNVGDATAWGSEIDVGSGDYTYCSLVQFSDGTIYLLYRNISGGTGRLAYRTSTDGGATWSGETLLLTGGSSKVPYWRIVSNWTDRIDVFVTDDSPNTSTTQLYHFYFTASGRFKSDGTTISTSLPITVSDCTLVKSSSGGPCWSWGGSWDGTAPATVIMQSITSGTDCAVFTARWRSGAWQVNQVVASVGGILDSNLYASGAGIHHENPNRVMVAKKVSSHWEMFRYVSTDDGVTWTPTTLTTGSSVDNVWADFVDRCLDSALEAVWLTGSYTSDTSYTWALEGEYLA